MAWPLNHLDIVYMYTVCWNCEYNNEEPGTAQTIFYFKIYLYNHTNSSNRDLDQV